MSRRRFVLGLRVVGVGALGLLLLIDAPRMAVRAGRGWLRARRLRLADVMDHLIPGPGGPIPIRIYRPDGAAPLPALVFFHGGGWAYGDLDSHDALCRALARASRCLVVAVDYRLAPMHRFPAALDDAYAATQWVAAEAGMIGADTAHLAVGGDSAGGNLAAAVALIARDRGGPRLAFQLLVYPVLDCSFDTASYIENEAFGPARAEMMALWRQYLPTEAGCREPYAAPLRAADLQALPPTLIITAGLDTLRDEGEAYAARLRAHGVPVTLTRYPGAQHAFLTTSDSDDGRRAICEAGDAMRAVWSGSVPRLP